MQTIGTPEHSNIQHDNGIDRVEQIAAAVGVDDPASAETIELLGRRGHLSHRYRDEVTARERVITDMVARNRDRHLSRDDGLEL